MLSVMGICAGHTLVQAEHAMHIHSVSLEATRSKLFARMAAMILLGGKSIKYPTGHTPLQSPH
jgi:hypothetical protein